MPLCVSGIAINAQTPAPTTTAGQVCRITNFRIKPGKAAEFVRFRRENTKKILDEQKKQGLIVSYAYYTKPVLEGRDDADLIGVTCYKNYADAIDFNPERAAKFDAIGLKHYGSDEARTKANASLNDLREVISSFLVREQILLPIAP
jgi:hypothetical protein